MSYVEKPLPDSYLDIVKIATELDIKTMEQLAYSALENETSQALVGYDLEYDTGATIRFLTYHFEGASPGDNGAGIQIRNNRTNVDVFTLWYRYNSKLLHKPIYKSQGDLTEAKWLIHDLMRSQQADETEKSLLAHVNWVVSLMYYQSEPTAPELVHMTNGADPEAPGYLVADIVRMLVDEKATYKMKLRSRKHNLQDGGVIILQAESSAGADDSNSKQFPTTFLHIIYKDPESSTKLSYKRQGNRLPQWSWDLMGIDSLDIVEACKDKSDDMTYPLNIRLGNVALRLNDATSLTQKLVEVAIEDACDSDRI